MIEYDKNRLSDPEYVKELLEGKYIKADKHDNDIIHIKEIKFIPFKNSGYIMDIYQVYMSDDILKAEERKRAFEFIKILCEDYSFTTKKEFMNSCNKVMEEIKKGTEKNE